jgi:hypothetical protein
MRGYFWRQYFWFAVPAALLSFTAAKAEEVPPCPDVAGIETARYPDGVPPAVVDDFTARFNPFVLPGENFDAGGLVMTHVSRRLIWVKHLNQRWVVAYEQGGRSYSDHVLLYKAAMNELTALPQVDREVAPDRVCGIADGLLQDTDD